MCLFLRFVFHTHNYLSQIGKPGSAKDVANRVTKQLQDAAARGLRELPKRVTVVLLDDTEFSIYGGPQARDPRNLLLVTKFLGVSDDRRDAIRQALEEMLPSNFMALLYADFQHERHEGRLKRHYFSQFIDMASDPAASKLLFKGRN